VELTLIGGLVVALGLSLSIVSQQRLVQCIVFFASFSGTAVLNSGEYGMAPDVVLLAFLLLASLLSGRLLLSARVSYDHLIIGLLILLFTLIAVVSLLSNGALYGLASLQITQTAYLLFGICLTVVLSIEFSVPERLEAGLAALRASATFVSLWGLLQAACYYTGVEYPAFLFNNSKSHFADMYDQRAAEGVVRIASVATEPSFMAMSLMIFGAFGVTVISLDPLRRTKSWIIPVLLTLATVALSTSSTGYFGLAVLCLLLAPRRPMFALAVFGSAAVAGGVLLAAIPGARDAFYNMTLGKFQGGTYIERSTTLGPAMELFARHPWFGFGWGADFSYSIVTQMLANVGIAGSMAFLFAVMATMAASRTARKRFANGSHFAVYAEAAENALLVYLAEAVVSGFKYVVADFWCLWAFAIAIPSCLICVKENVRPSFPIRQSWPRRVDGQRLLPPRGT
jgi:hypothetical protein